MRGFTLRFPLLLGLVVAPAFAACTAQGEGRPAAAAIGEVPQGYVRTSLAVDGMTCAGCVLAAKVALARIDGVLEADAALDEQTGKGRAWAVYDPERVQADRLIAAIRELGYDATLMEG